jgi:tight adherence protein C
MKKGRRRNEALSLWANRCELVYISDVVSSMIQAEQTGASLGSVLKHHAQAVLRENEAVIQRRAERLPVRMLMPMAGCILPAVIIVAAGPSIVRIMQIIDDIISK